MSFQIKQDGWGSVGDYGFESRRLWFTGAATAGNAVALQAADTTNPAGVRGFGFRQADSANADSTQGICGIVMETITAAGYAQVQIAGLYSGANVDSAAAVAIGDGLRVGATAGRLVELLSTDTPNFRCMGMCMSTPAANAADVLIYKHPMFD